MKLPRITSLQVQDTHRLISSKHSGGGVLSRLADDKAHLEDIFDLDHATNDRLLAENELMPGIGVGELVFRMPGYSVVNASFCHPSPQGGRFNGPDRGAWYAGFDLATSQAEILFHKTKEYAEIDWDKPDVTSYDDYLANFDGEFHDIREDQDFLFVLDPNSYYASQTLAEELLRCDSLGIIYPSVRVSGTCIACLRPAAVINVRKSATYLFHWVGQSQGGVWG